MSETVAPNSTEGEEAVLGSILINPDSLVDVAEYLGAADFFIVRNAWVYEAIQAVDERGDQIDSLTVIQELRSRGKLDEIGGSAYITHLLNNTPTHIHASTYARIVERAAIRRRLLSAASEIAQTALEEDALVEDIIDHCEATLYGVTEGRRRNMPTIGEIVSAYYDDVDRMYQIKQQGNRATLGLPTGYPKLDNLISGLERGRLYILAARPGMGKTALMVNIACYIAQTLKLSSGFMSLEMTADQLIGRMASGVTGINGRRIRLGEMDSAEWDRFTTATGMIHDWPIDIDDTPAASIPYMRNKFRKWQRQGVSLIFVDFLQLATAGHRVGTREQEVSYIARSLKNLAREMDVPIIAAAQLNRELEKRPDKRPMLSDLRECVTGSTRLINAQTGQWMPIRDTVAGNVVLGVDTDQHIKPFPVGRVWSTGIKPVFTVTTRTGRQLTATANHPLLTASGWRRIEDLQIGDTLATALRLPAHGCVASEAELCRLLGYLVGDGTYQQHRAIGFISSDPATFEDVLSIVDRHFPGVTVRMKTHTNKNYQEADFVCLYANGYGKPYGNPLREWLRGQGLVGQRDTTKRVPKLAFDNRENASHFLAGYLASDGCVKTSTKRGSLVWEVHFDTVCRALAEDVQALLLAIGTVASINKPQLSQKAVYPIYRLNVAASATNLRNFGVAIPQIGRKGNLLAKMLQTLPINQTGTQLFGLPREVSAYIAAQSSWRDQGKRMRRDMCLEWANRLDSDELYKWATSDLLWESIVAVDPAGEEETFDIAIPGCGNFLANGIVAHNSGEIEQSADSVIFVYRDEVYNLLSEDKGKAELVVAKNRDGETGKVMLAFRSDITRFQNL